IAGVGLGGLFVFLGAFGEVFLVLLPFADEDVQVNADADERQYHEDERNDEGLGFVAALFRHWRNPWPYAGWMMWTSFLSVYAICEGSVNENDWVSGAESSFWIERRRSAPRTRHNRLVGNSRHAGDGVGVWLGSEV